MDAARILCIGPVYVDINCTDFPCENGLGVEREAFGRRYEITPGGSAANFARFGRYLGLKTELLSKIGDDLFGTALRGMLEEADIKPVFAVGERSQTTLGLNLVAPSGATVMASVGAVNETLTASELNRLIRAMSSGISHIYLGGCFKFPHLLPLLRDISRSMREQSVAVILDHGRIPEETPTSVAADMRALARSVDFYLPSRDEFLSLWGTDDMDMAARIVLDGATDDNQVVAVKNGALGAIGYTDDERVSVAAYPVQAGHLVGAGDSFNAGFVAANRSGLNLADCLDFACATAAVKISKPKSLTMERVVDFRHEHRKISIGGRPSPSA